MQHQYDVRITKYRRYYIIIRLYTMYFLYGDVSPTFQHGGPIRNITNIRA